MKKIENIAYAENPHSQQHLDLYLPEQDSFPLFVYFHGGGLEAGDKSNENRVYEYMASRGIAIVTANYRMYPSAHYPDFLCDAAAVVKWAFDHIANYGNVTDVFVGGTSAGGYISMMLCFDNRWLGAQGIDPAKIAGWVHDAGQPTAHYNVLRERGIDTRRVIVDDSAPLYHVGERSEYSPMLFIVSDNDLQNRYEQTMLMQSTLKHFGHGDKAVSVRYMHGKHCEYVNQSDENGNSVFGQIVEEFIKA
ncbi:MAG: alpha/beta hydrolase [Clostridia bacterium]|nr:alpha/beta hydrolase [Clostridia bacterium]